MPSRNHVHETDGPHSEVTEPTMMSDLGRSASLEEEGPREGGLQNEVAINMLPDNMLLEIFHFYKDDPASFDKSTWSWRTLIHVCQRWRYVIFASPRRLDLRLHCSDSTPTRRLLNIWLPFPITIALYSFIDEATVNEGGLDNILAGLECRDRISIIYIFDYINGSALEKLMTMMHEPFPNLTECCFVSSNKLVSMPVLPETFLGGSAPLLRTFWLTNIPFPTFPSFVLSSTQIQRLSLLDIPDYGYISPEIMATCLAALPNLIYLSIGFQSSLSHLLQRTPLPLERIALPTLTRLSFEGVSDYFEDFIARIETPQLALLTVTFPMDFIFGMPRLHDFMNRTQRTNRASIELDSWMIKMMLESQAQFKFELRIKCETLDQKLSSMTQIFSQQLPLLSQVEHFEIREPRFSTYYGGWEDETDRLQFLELFLLLPSVQRLYVSERFVHRVAASLKEFVGEMAMEILPALCCLSLEGHQPSGPVQDFIQSFVAARELINRPVVVQPWERKELEGV